MLHPTEKAAALLMAFYRNLEPLYLGLEGEGVCQLGAFSCGPRHRCVECPTMLIAALDLMALIADMLIRGALPGVLVETCLAGCLLSKAACPQLLITWAA